ncbi:dTDP-glucose 4,6-dehydratase [Priestia megaterium]|uniref:dTDP-glucose 4,6-dehydratase n=1 Tax=Priestia megaterium TaxID=1404 RepID=UPI003EE8FBFE
MNLLVTGGLGFIGSNFIKFMLASYKKYKIINLDKITYAGNLDNLKKVKSNSNYKFVQGDICDAKLVETVIKEEKIDVIVNFAAESHVDRSFLTPHVFVQTNIMGTQILLDLAMKNDIKKYVQISTDEVYGELGNDGYFNEKTPLSPTNPYSASKAGADFIVKAYHDTYGIDVSFVRFANTYGPFQYPEKLIPMTITNALENNHIAVHGNGASIRDWLFVKDNIRAIDLVIHKGKPGNVYNIGAREERSTIDVVETILEILNKPKSLIHFVDDRLSQDYRYANDPTKIMEELGWAPTYDFREGILETIKWYQHNDTWWQLLKDKGKERLLLR